MAGVSPRFDLPTPDPSTEPFWDAARQGRLVIRRCQACRRAHFYPRPFCPSCWSDQVSWEEASGRATLYTWSVVYQNDLPPFGERVPYVAAVVDLEEGPRMMTNVVDCAVFGVPDPVLGERLKAVVELRAPGVGAEDLISHCRARLANFKCPEILEIVDTLPRDPNGKVLKRLLRDAHWVGTRSAVAAE